MACMKLGSKSEVFQLDSQTWLCSSGLPSDVTIEVGEWSFHLHKIPLLSRSGLLENQIAEVSGAAEKKCVLQLHDIPGGAIAFSFIAKFCYGVKIDLTASNVVSLRCAAEYLRMTDEYGEGNLIIQTENFLIEVFGNWTDSIRALETCEEVLQHAEKLHIVSRCINSLAMKACADPSLFSWPMSNRTDVNVLWNGISISAKPQSVTEDWWYEEVSFLRLPLYKRLILAVGMSGIKPESIVGSIIHYAKRHLPLLGRQSSFHNGTQVKPMSIISAPSEEVQSNLLEELVELLPDRKRITPTKFLLRLLRTSMKLQASQSCRENLEKRIGSQLDQAALQDLLIPNMGYTVETLYDIDCVQRMLDYFMLLNHDTIDSNCIIDEGQLIGGSHSPTPMTMVANLVDGYLAEVAPDVNLKLPKFQSIASVIPDYARPLDDGIYRAIDIFLKAHPWLMDSEREQICRLMDCQKLSLEASTHAAQNERLPLRVIVQVLFSEQFRLRTSVTGWFFVSNNLDNSQNPSGDLALTRNDCHAQARNSQDSILAVNDMRERVSDLEKECMSMRHEIEKLVKTKGSWNAFAKKFSFRLKSKSSGLREPKPCNSEEPPSSMALLTMEKKIKVMGIQEM